MKFIITEKQDIKCERRGVPIEARGLSAAKRIATLIQVYNDTVVVIENLEGHTLAVKEKSGDWIDQSYFA